MNDLTLTQLLEKYDVPVPRYTSYPAVPNWGETPPRARWVDALNRAVAHEAVERAVHERLRHRLVETARDDDKAASSARGCSLELGHHKARRWPSLRTLVSR